MKKRKIVVIIPARGGSKRILFKNIQLLAGKPLIAYTIQNSLKSNLIDRTIVSTDNEKIADIARNYGEEVIMRPDSLAGDESPTEQTMIHVVETLKKEKYDPEYVVLLQPTSPIRKLSTINEGIKMIIESDADSLLSVCEIQHYYLSGHFEGEEYKPDYSQRQFSHKMPKKYRENGALYITKKDFLINNENRIGGKIRAIIMNNVDSIDIDDISDFELAEKIIRGDYYEQN